MSMDDLSTPNLARSASEPAAHVDTAPAVAEASAEETQATEGFVLSPHDLATQLVG